MNQDRISLFARRNTKNSLRFLVLSGEDGIIPHVLDLLKKHPQATVTILDNNISVSVLDLFTKTTLPINIILAPYSKELAVLFDRVYYKAQITSLTPSSNYRSIPASCT